MISVSVRSILLLVTVLTLFSHVCCSPTSSEFKLRTRSKIDTSNNNLHNYNATDDFGNDRIVGGYYAQKNQFPFIAVVHRLMGRGYIAQCGGTILSRRWVLTAGHCVGTNRAQFLLVFGIVNKSGIGYDFYNGPGVSMITRESYLHPNYEPAINDIGLLRTPMNIPFAENILPIQLLGYNDMHLEFDDEIGVVIGWGIDGQNRPPTRRLKYATLPIISTYECQAYWDVTKEKHVCTAPNYGQDACQGDSGGPLIVYNNYIPYQIGVVSYGDGLCPSDKPGVFSKVAAYNGWISKITGILL